MPYQLQEIRDLRRQRRELGEQVRAIYAQCREEEREPTADEDQRIDAMLDDGEQLRERIHQMERADGLLEDLDQPEGRATPSPSPLADDAEDAAEELEDRQDVELEEVGNGPRDTPEYRRLYRQFLMATGSAQAMQIAHRAHEYRIEHRDLQTDDDEQAGYLVPPEQMVMEIIQALDDEVMLRDLARTFTVRQARSLGAPKRTAKASTWSWGSEIEKPTADTSLKFGKRNLHPHYASGEIKASRDFLRSSLINAEEYVRDEIARDGGELEENAFLTGSGAEQPLGLFTASDDGLSTSVDVSTGNTATEVTLEGLREAKYSLKASYWPRLRWLGSRTFHKQLYSLDDGEGRPLLVESLRTGELDRALGFPVLLSEFAPETFTTGQYVAILGDFRFYWIADALDIEIQRLDELYARSNQVGFIARLKTDGMPVLEEAFARVKLG